MRSFLAVVLTATLAHALPARDYYIEHKDGYLASDSVISTETSSSSSIGWGKGSHLKHTATTDTYPFHKSATSSASRSSSTSWSKTRKQHRPQKSEETSNSDGGHHGACAAHKHAHSSVKQGIAYAHDTTYGSPSGGFYGSAGYPAGLANPIEHDGPVETLTPVVHWNVDTAPAENVIPVPVGHGCPQYYAQGGNTGK